MSWLRWVLWGAKVTSRPLYVPWSLCFPDTFLSQLTTEALHASNRHDTKTCRPQTASPHTSKHARWNAAMLSSKDVLDFNTSNLAECPRLRQLRWFCVNVQPYKRNSFSLISQLFLLNCKKVKCRFIETFA